jgi:protein-disulfide isomerase
VLSKENNISLSPSLVILVALIFMAMMGFGGYMYGKVSTLEKNTNSVQANPAQPQAQQPAQPQVSIDSIKGLFDKNVIKFGNGDKKLVMVEVADPSCPFCHVAAGLNGELNKQMGQQFMLKADGGNYVAPVPEMKKLVEQGKADFVWLYTNGHGNGELATKALYCAFDQGKFWQAHDLFMTAKGYTLINDVVKNDASKSQQVADFLASAVDKNKLKSCLDSGKFDTRLAEDSTIAKSLGVNGTPGFYLNTTNFSGAYSWTDMKSVADAALK